jgi:hypothetical protein
MASSSPKLLNLSASTIRNQRTLIWLKKQSTTINWSKWDGIVTSLEEYHYWTSHQAHIVGMILTEIKGDTDQFIQDLFLISKHVPMILLNQTILSCKSEEFWSDNFDNLLSLDDLLDQYPFLNTPWNGSHEDAILLFALICRYHRVVDCVTHSSRNLYDITLERNIIPQQIYMVTQFFRHSSKKRFQEIKECLRRNCACPFIDQIVLINEKDYSYEWNDIPNHHKIKQVVLGTRLTYADFLRYTYENIPYHTFTILCNADIYFEDSLNDLWKINMTDRMLGLLRWDDDGRGPTKATLFGPRADSQDTWIFLSDSIKNKSWNWNDFQFQLGQAGCDNAFAGKMLYYRFLLSNPALTLKTYHLHNTNIRNYNKKDYIKSNLYINLAPTYLIDTKQECTPKDTPQHVCNELVSFEVKSSSLSNEITYCTMLEKDGRYKWEPQVENHYFEPAIPVYSWKNACVTPNGLVYDLYHIYTGKYAVDNELFNYWKTAKVDIFTPLQKRTRMFAIPFLTTDVFSHPDTYLLNYVSRCARLLSSYPNTSFWIPKQYSEIMDVFNWKETQLQGVYFDEQTACWADEVVGYLPSPSSLELGKEDITALRTLLPSWMNQPTGKVCTIITDNIITSDFVEKVGTFLLSKVKGWSIRVVSSEEHGSYNSLLGSSLCIFMGGKKTQTKWAKLWTLPKECCVVEFQQELLMDGEFQHVAHVSELKSWILLLSKGNQSDVQDQILTQLEKWFKKNQMELVF